MGFYYFPCMFHQEKQIMILCRRYTICGLFSIALFWICYSSFTLQFVQHFNFFFRLIDLKRKNSLEYIDHIIESFDNYYKWIRFQKISCSFEQQKKETRIKSYIHEIFILWQVLHVNQIKIFPIKNNWLSKQCKNSWICLPLKCVLM